MLPVLSAVPPDEPVRGLQEPDIMVGLSRGLLTILVLIAAALLLLNHGPQRLRVGDDLSSLFGLRR